MPMRQKWEKKFRFWQCRLFCLLLFLSSWQALKRCNAFTFVLLQWLMDPDPAPDPSPDLIPFFIDFKDAKKNHIFFFYSNLPTSHYLQSKVFNFLLKFCVKILFGRRYFSPLNTFMRKAKYPDPEPYLWIMDPDPDPGDPKTCGSCWSWSGFWSQHWCSAWNKDLVYSISIILIWMEYCILLSVIFNRSSSIVPHQYPKFNNFFS